MLTEIFGTTCKRAKVFDLLLSHPYTEYTKTDIAECAEISRNTLDTFIDDLVEYGIINLTRRIGNGQLYQINMKSTITQALNSFQNQLADIEFEKEMEKYKEEENVDIKPIKPFEEIIKKEMKKDFDGFDDKIAAGNANESIRIIGGPLESAVLEYYLGESGSQTSIISTENSMPKKIITPIYD